MIIRIDITEANFPGCYFVTVDDDPEHYLSTSCVSPVEAIDHAINILEEMKP